MPDKALTGQVYSAEVCQSIAIARKPRGYSRLEVSNGRRDLRSRSALSWFHLGGVGGRAAETAKGQRCAAPLALRRKAPPKVRGRYINQAQAVAVMVGSVGSR
jgi:hypothetical protein